ncbi:hypothetical protein BDF19DRAFT_438466 [Syncephalis fuscata]|nr:hypothetical protein BDF19DRAFT_438466 [Syncephalis fuscata]
MRGFYTILIATSSLLVGPMITSTDAVPWFNIKNWFSRPPLNYEFTVDELAKINADESLTIKECLGPKTYHTAPWVMETTTKKPMWIIAPSVQSSPEWSRLSFRPAAASYQIIPPANGPTYIICAKDKKLVTTTRLRLMRLRKGAWFVGPALPKQISRGYSATKVTSHWIASIMHLLIIFH